MNSWYVYEPYYRTQNFYIYICFMRPGKYTSVLDTMRTGIGCEQITTFKGTINRHYGPEFIAYYMRSNWLDAQKGDRFRPATRKDLHKLNEIKFKARIKSL